MLEKTLSPQLVKTHLLVQLLLTSFQDKNCKITPWVPPVSLPIQVVGRRALLCTSQPHPRLSPGHLHGPQPQDVIFSHYYFYQMAKMHPDPSTLGEFLETFMAGKGGGLSPRVPILKHRGEGVPHHATFRLTP